MIRISRQISMKKKIKRITVSRQISMEKMQYFREEKTYVRADYTH